MVYAFLRRRVEDEALLLLNLPLSPQLLLQLVAYYKLPIVAHISHLSVQLCRGKGERKIILIRQSLGRIYDFLKEVQ